MGLFRKEIAIMAAPALELPTAPASDVKKRGWRGMMRLARDRGAVVVTHHNEPEAVIVPMADYTRLLEAARHKEAADAAIVEELRQKFDRQLAVLNQPDAAERMERLSRTPIRLRGRVKLW